MSTHLAAQGRVDGARRLNESRFDHVLAADGSGANRKNASWAVAISNGDLHVGGMGKAKVSAAECKAFCVALDFASTLEGQVLIVSDHLPLSGLLEKSIYDAAEALGSWVADPWGDGIALNALEHLELLSGRLTVAHLRGHQPVSVGSRVQSLHKAADMGSRWESLGRDVPGTVRRFFEMTGLEGLWPVD